MTRSNPLALTPWGVVAAVLLWPAVGIADTVELSGGGHLTGKVQRKSDVVIVEIDDEIHVAIRGSRVRRVVTSDQLQRYREMVIKAGNDAESHYQLAIWCVTGDNVPGESQRYKNYHMQRAVALDPEHARARAALGYKKHEGKWIRTTDLMRDRGMISVAGRWELPEAVAIEELQDETNVDAKRWIREVNRLTSVVLRNTSKSQESLETLKAIDDPLAASAIARQLKESREKGTQSRALRMIWVQLLGRFRNIVSVEALVRAGIDEQDEMIREAALDQLTQYGASSAVSTYLPMLNSNDNQLVNRAARALSWFPDPELAMTYVDALVTTHKHEVAPAGPGMQAAFSNDGGGGLSTGGKPTVVTQKLTNPSVLALLTTIEPEAGFGYDEQAWRQYFANQRTAFSGDLRRDP